MKKTHLLGLFFIFIIAFFLRTLYLPRLAVTFGYDQARDAFVTHQILEGDIKILGPPASTPGLYHGVFYYYLLAPAYLLGKGSPIITTYWIALLNAGTVFIVFYLTYLMLGEIKAGLLAAFLFAISFEATQYATWLSNPTIGVWTVPVIYLGLWMWVKNKNKWGPIVTALGLGLSIQAEIFLAYHIIPVGIWLWIARKQIVKNHFKNFIGVLTITLSSMIISEFKFGFKSLSGISSLLSGKDVVTAGKNIGDFVVLYLNQLGLTFSNAIFPSNAGYGGILGIVMIVWVVERWKKSKNKKAISWELFLISYLLAHLPIVSLGGVSTPFLTVGLGTAAVILVASVIFLLWDRKKAFVKILLLLIILSNVVTIISKNRKGQVIFAIQKDMRLDYELAVVDDTYIQADGKPFSINTLTSPLWINTTWSYLYNWYGKQKYGYLPQWRGRDQIGQLGNNLPSASKDTILHFYILEPQQGIPSKYLESEPAFEDSRSQLIEEKEFGELKVQKRKIIEIEMEK